MYSMVSQNFIANKTQHFNGKLLILYIYIYFLNVDATNLKFRKVINK